MIRYLVYMSISHRYIHQYMGFGVRGGGGIRELFVLGLEGSCLGGVCLD